MLSRKVEPLLKRVEQAAKSILSVGSSNTSISKIPGPMSMLSKMGGRLISFYADDLTELLLNDFLIDTATELQKIEASERKDYSGQEARHLADTLLKTLVDYQGEESLIEMRWNNLAGKNKHQGRSMGSGFDSLSRDPQPIMFNLSEELSAEKAGRR